MCVTTIANTTLNGQPTPTNDPISAYIEAGYRTCVIPKVSVKERVELILAQVNTGAYQGAPAVSGNHKAFFPLG